MSHAAAALPLYLDFLVLSNLLLDRAQAIPNFDIPNKIINALPILSTALRYRRTDLNQLTGVNLNPNGSAFLWLPEDNYSGQTFFE